MSMSLFYDVPRRIESSSPFTNGFLCTSSVINVGESHKLSSSSSYLSELVSCSSSSCSVCLLVLRRLFCEKVPFVLLYHLFSLNLNYIEAVTTNLLCYVQVKAPNLSIDQLSVRCSLPGCLLHRSLPLCRPHHLICTGSDIARRTHGYPVLSDT